jgi:VIT1/CCC1 family predicted Fe2+/Mn2+ transporter
MPHHHHKHKAHGEHHFRASALVRDIVIGMADGLTVPFALAAGLAGATDAARIVITGGLAEIAAGAIAMGLGGYLAARTDAEHYASEYARELRETVELPIEERAEVEEIFRRQGLEGAALTQVTEAVTSEQKRWVEFMMRYELGLEEPEAGRALTSAGTIGLSYIAGGLIPLAPYMLMGDIGKALPLSVLLTLIALFGFGYGKALFTGSKPLKGGAQTMLVGGLAAAAAYFIAGLVR